MSRARSLLAFHAVHTEGGLLPQDILQRVALEDKTLPGLTPDAYHLPEGERFRDAVNHAWGRLTVAWRSFRAALDKLPGSTMGLRPAEPGSAPSPAGDPATTVTRERWLLPLFDALGYGRLPRASTFEIDSKSYAISHAYHKSPIHLLGCRVGLDAKQKGIAGAAAASPHGLVQDFLNRSDGHLWGLVSNGYVLRILRDHHSLTQQAYVEFDLQAIMEGEAFSEFFLLFLVCHQSRVEADKPEECWLEKWFQAAREEGVRALEKLRAGVVGAIAALGSGFLKQKQANKALLQKLESGDLDKQDYYRQLLRLAYRLIFLFVAEDRGALLNPVPKATEAARARYERFYSTKRLRDLADKRRGGPHGDLWQQLRLVMNKLGDGSPELGLPALGSFLWSERAIRDLSGLELANEDLLGALRALCYVEQGKARYAVSWRNIGAEELGSVYESLLELHPSIHKEAARFELDTAAGHERKTTGSYYTPTSLVDCLLDSALDPVLDEAAKKPDPEKAILELKICDPACGSGHFLVAAARRMAMRLALVRSGGEEPSPPEVQRALRDVVGKCIYGVDLNPMAVELCKVSLWMEAIEPGKPLSFLEGHIQHGNALLGATPALMAKGIPDEAFEVIEGDDKDVAKRLKKRNREARKTGQGTLFAGFAQEAPVSYYGRITTAAGRVEDDKDDDIAAVRKKEGDWEHLTASEDFRKAMFLADAWCAAFVWPKQKGVLEDGAITEDLWRRMEQEPAAAPAATKREVSRLAGEFSFFHWHIAFPQVFFAGDQVEDEATGWTGGFDAVLGNPPWERITLKEKEWFSQRNSEITSATTGAARAQKIKSLERTDPELYAAFINAKRRAAGEKALTRDTGAYPLCGQGDVNTFALFAERMRSITHDRVGAILPTGIATTDTTKEFFANLVTRRQLANLFDFDNRAGLFPAVQGNVRFCLMSLTRQGAESFEIATQVTATADLRIPERRYRLTEGDIRQINPNTLSCPLFLSRADAELIRSVYASTSHLDADASDRGERWPVELRRMFHSGDDSELFRSMEELQGSGFVLSGPVFRKDERTFVPLLEAKLAHQYNHRAGTFQGTSVRRRFGTHAATNELTSDELADSEAYALPRYWIDKHEVVSRIGSRSFLLGFRDAVSAIADARSLVACFLPPYGAGHTLQFLYCDDAAKAHCATLAWFNSFVVDFVFRQKSSGGHASFFILRQLPIWSFSALSKSAPWDSGVLLEDWMMPRVLELSYTAWDLAGLGEACGYDGPPFRWNDGRRARLRAELDAAVFHLFKLKREQAEYVLESFDIVKRRDIAAHGSYRTKDTILDIYDRMQQAITTGEPYQTLLDPPPADPRVAHPPRPAA